VTDPSGQGSTPRQATWLVWRQPAHLTTGDHALRARLRQAPPAFAQAMALAPGCVQRLRARQPERLEPCLQQAATSSLAAFQRLAQSFQRDYAAVKARVSGPWSTSPVEGHMNRLTMLKRQMFGRARLDLLSRRFLLAPRERQGQAVDRSAPAQIHAVAA
jgi:transposase